MKMTKDELVAKLQIQDVDKDTQDQLLQDLANTVSMRIVNRVSEQLSDDDLNQLNDLIDKGDDDAVEWFIKSKFDHYDNFVEQIEEEVVNEVAHNIAAVNDAYNGEGKPSAALNL